MTLPAIRFLAQPTASPFPEVLSGVGLGGEYVEECADGFAEQSGGNGDE